MFKKIVASNGVFLINFKNLESVTFRTDAENGFESEQYKACLNIDTKHSCLYLLFDNIEDAKVEYDEIEQEFGI
jgi:hypothetical protein